MASQATSSRMTLFSHPHCCLKHPCCPQVARNCIVLPAWVKCSTACWSSSMVAVYTNLHPPMTPHPPNPIVACHSEAPVVKVATDFTDLQAMNGLHGTIVNGQLQYHMMVFQKGAIARTKCCKVRRRAELKQLATWQKLVASTAPSVRENILLALTFNSGPGCRYAL